MIADGSQPNNTSAVIASAIAGAVCGSAPTCNCPEVILWFIPMATILIHYQKEIVV